VCIPALPTVCITACDGRTPSLVHMPLDHCGTEQKPGQRLGGTVCHVEWIEQPRAPVAVPSTGMSRGPFAS
jgi:hypothetical protein